MVGTVIRHAPRINCLLKTTDPVLKTHIAGRCPRTSHRLRAAQEREEDRVSLGIDSIGLFGEVRRECWQVVDIGDQPRLRAIGEIGVGQQDHRSPIGHRQSSRFHRRVEALRRRGGGHNRERRLSVAPEERLEEVRLLSLGGQARRGSGALDVNDDEGKFKGDCETDHLRLEIKAGARRGGHAEGAPIGRPECRPDACDFILRLERPHSELLALGELVEDV